MSPAFPFFALLGIMTTLHAADAPDPTLKLREQLRATMLQLRSVQTESANMQVAQIAAEAKAKELEIKVAELDKRNASLAERANSDKAASEETIASLNKKVSDREKRIVQFEEALVQWKAGYQKAAEIARTKEDERAKLAAENTDLKHTVADRERKNISLFNTSNEILERFQNYALGKAIGAKEPFIGTSRVKVENLVQGYKDKIIDNRIAAKAPQP